MKPILYPADETQFVSNGLGRLSDAISCKVTEERNGQYELELQYPVTGKHYDAICEERIIAARHDDTSDIQPFRIYKITRPMNGKVTVNARHISYQLSKVVVMPFTAQSCVAALQGMNSHSLGDNPFTMWTDKSLTAPFKIEVPSSFRSMLGGVQGSILDVYGPGEFEWDKYTVKFHSRRGLDTKVTIRYGKNLTDLKKTTDMSNVWTGVVPYWSGTDDSNNPILVTLSAPVYASTVSDYAYKLIIPVDFSGSFQERPTEAQLRQKAEQYVQNNADTSIPASIDISFVALWQTEEYKNVAPLQRLQLCDNVTVHHKGLGIDTTAKIVSVTYDVLLERYEKMTLGEVKTSLGDAMREMATEAIRDVPTTSAMQQAIQRATNLITGGLGGHVVLTMNTNGQPEEILILDTDSVDTAVEVLRINRNGIGFSSHGYEGPFESAWTLDGHFVADFITTGNLNAALITTGVIQDAHGYNFWDMDTGEFQLASTTKVGNQTLASYIADNVSGGLSKEAIFNKLTDNGRTQGIYMSNGLL
ncbi:MAG: phage tail protein [Clostridiales bacterium]|nr:phage tail protein [Clostridiales bacterium]